MFSLSSRSGKGAINRRAKKSNGRHALKVLALVSAISVGIMPMAAAATAEEPSAAPSQTPEVAASLDVPETSAPAEPTRSSATPKAVRSNEPEVAESSAPVEDKESESSEAPVKTQAPATEEAASNPSAQVEERDEEEAKAPAKTQNTEKTAAAVEPAEEAGLEDSENAEEEAAGEEASDDDSFGIMAGCTDPQNNPTPVAGFEIDGNLCSNVADDWDSLGGQPIMNDGYADATGFKQGASESNSTWTAEQLGGSLSPNDSTDIGSVYAATRQSGNDVYAVFGFERATANGTVGYYVELNAKPNKPIGSLSSGQSPLPNRSEGDLRLRIFQNGQDLITLEGAEYWHLGAGPGGTAGWTELSLGSGNSPFAGRANLGNIHRIASSVILSEGRFAEVGVNLTRLFGDQGCSGNYGTLNIRSSSSASGTSSLKDWIAPHSFNVPSSCSSLQIDKEWLIDGEIFSDGEQPDGFAAQPVLSGRAQAEFGTPYFKRDDNTEYRSGQSVTIDETSVVVPAGCTNESSGDLGAHVLAPGINEYTITNTVSCTHLTLQKEVAAGDAAATAWTLQATGPGNASLAGASGSEAVTGARVAPGTYKLSELNGPAGYQQTGLACSAGELVGDEITIAQGQNVTCTFTNTATTSLSVSKTWEINGEEYANGEQPFGEAKLELDGEETPFGTVKTGLLAGQEVRIEETVSGLPERCELVEVLINNETADNQSASYKLRQAAEDNVVPMVNVVECTQLLTLVKNVDNQEFGGTSQPADWTLSATAEGDDEPSVTGVSGSDAVKEADVEAGTSYTLEEKGTAQYANAYQPGAWTCEGGTFVDGKITLDFGEAATCTIVNTALPGSVVWKKTDTSHTPLPGSEWTLTGPAGAEAAEQAVTDCTDAPCDGPDQDPAAGSFKLEGLSWGNYELVESAAPPGYVVDKTKQEFSIASEQLDYEFAAAFENKQQDGPSLPLTGGLGRDHVYLLGGGVLALGLVGLGIRRFRQRNAR